MRPIPALVRPIPALVRLILPVYVMGNNMGTLSRREVDGYVPAGRRGTTLAVPPCRPAGGRQRRRVEDA